MSTDQQLSVRQPDHAPLPTGGRDAFLEAWQFDPSLETLGEVAVVHRMLLRLGHSIKKVKGTEDFLIFDPSIHRYRREPRAYSTYLGTLLDYLRQMILAEAADAERLGQTKFAESLDKLAARMNSHGFREGVLRAALRHVEEVPSDELDARTGLVVVKNGVLDLDAGGILRPGRPEDLATHSMAASFDPDCPVDPSGNRWADQLERSVADPETAAALWR